MTVWAWLVRIATTAPCLGCSGRVPLRRPFGARVYAYCERCQEWPGPFGACIRAQMADGDLTRAEADDLRRQGDG